MEYSNNPFFLADEDDTDEDDEDCMKPQDNYPNTSKLLSEISSFFKLDNLVTSVRSDEKKELKKNISISKIIMDNIIDKKLGSTTYHYAGGKSSKAYYTYDYPEIYYNKKLYNNISHWLKEEYSKKI
jgi:hypothetical protein